MRAPLVRVRGLGRVKSTGEEQLALQLRVAGLPEPEREHRAFKAHGREFRFDFAWPDRKLAVEVDGGTWSGGRHNRGAGVRSDCEKSLLAFVDGWRVLRVTTEMVA